MATCPECDADIEVDEFDVDKGDLISCPDCGANLEVTSTSPVELEAADDDDEDDDEDEEEEDDFDDDGRRRRRRRRRRERRRGLGRVSRAPLADAPGTTGGAAAGSTDTPPEPALLDKHAALRRILEDIPSLIVAYSGGVDSAYLAFLATDVLGARALCVTADSPSYPDRHRQLALSLAARVRSPSRDHSHPGARAARIPRQSREPLLLLQARALHASRRDRAGARALP